MVARQIYRFNPFTLDPAERRLLCNGEPVALTPKCFSLLQVLVENSGHLLEKDELLQKVWPNQFVEESNLSFNISALRKALGEGKDQHHYIETVSKKGFRFVAPVERVLVDEANEAQMAPSVEPPPTVSAVPQSGNSSRRLTIKILGACLVAAGLVTLIYNLWARRTAAIAEKPKTIAVLPFKPLNANSRDESLEIGMAETLITRLSNVRQLVVRPLGSINDYAEATRDPLKAGRELQAEVVLDGSIQKAEDRVRVTVRLLNVQTGATVWAEQFDENFTNIFKVQDSISERVAKALTPRLTGEEQSQLTKRYTNNAEAYQLYLQGHYLWTTRNQENVDKSFEYYQKAIEKDPNFALAYIGLAEANFTLLGSNRLPAKEVIPKVIANVNKALKLDPALAEAHNTLAEVKYQYEYDWPGAEKSFKQALELNPNAAYIHLAYGWFLMSASRFDQAEYEMQTAQQLDPTSMVINRARGRLFYFMRQYDRAIQHYQKILEVEPNVGLTHWSLARAYEQKEMYAEAFEEDLNAGRDSKLTPQLEEEFREVFRTSGYQAVIKKSIARMEERAKKNYVAPNVIAVSYARLGDKDQAFKWLEKAYAEHVPLSQLKIEPSYDSLRTDPRFTDLIRRINLTP